MALPSSGQISFSNVRTETSQSSMTQYTFGGWVKGAKNFSVPDAYTTSQTYAPINVLSSGSRFSVSTEYSSPYELSDWYSYNHTANIPTEVTGTLYMHVSPYDCQIPQSMLLIDAGTGETQYNINISGSMDGANYWYLYYGRPWTNIGTYDNTGSAIYITGGSGNPNLSFTYEYSYDPALGQYLYLVMEGVCP